MFDPEAAVSILPVQADQPVARLVEEAQEGNVAARSPFCLDVERAVGSEIRSLRLEAPADEGASAAVGSGA